MFSYEDCEIKENSSRQYLQSATKVLFSRDGNLMAYVDNEIIYVLDNSKIVNKIDISNIEVGHLKFDLSSKYLIVSTSNARVLQYRYNNPHMLSRLCSFRYDTSKKQKIDKNFATSIAFFDKKVACSSYDGRVVVIDLDTGISIDVVTNNRVRVDTLSFISEDTLVTGNANGIVEVISFGNGVITEHINTPFRVIKEILIIPNSHYAIVSSDMNYLSLIDIKNYKIVHSRYIEFDDIINSILLVEEKYLFVALKNLELIKVELATPQRLQSLMIHNSLDEAFELAESEPMLQETAEYEKLKSVYQNFFNQAVDALVNQNRDLALQLTDMFKISLLKKRK